MSCKRLWTTLESTDDAPLAAAASLDAMACRRWRLSAGFGNTL
jgi:hypothetical protein